MSDEIKSPGEIIRAELEKRGWTQSDLAEILGRDLPAVSQIITGKRSITPDMAVSIGAAFGNSAEYWLNLDGSYRVSQIAPDSEVERRARIFSFAPVRDMEKRGWIRATDTLDSLEKELLKFFHIDTLDAAPRINANARQPLKTDSLNSAQVAWCIRAGKIASALDAESFKPSVFKDALTEIRKLADFPEKTKHLPRILAKAGVRLVVVEPLLHSRIDGAAFWLADDAPVVVLSARFDRIDWLWFTLAHELSHIRHNDSQSVDTDLVGDTPLVIDDAIEQRANLEASSFLITPEAMKSFIVRVKPFYSKERIIQFSHRMQVHPGIVTGQLQFRKEIGYGANREMLAKVRDHLTSTTVTDGWGKSLPVL